MLLLALMQTTTPVPPAPPPEEDVVVIGRRLNAWRGAIRTNPLGTKCVTRTSSGDPQVDAIGCTAMERCWPEILPRMKVASAKGVAKADRKRLESEAGQAFVACVKPQRETLIQELRARRAAARASAA